MRRGRDARRLVHLRTQLGRDLVVMRLVFPGERAVRLEILYDSLRLPCLGENC